MDVMTLSQPSAETEARDREETIINLLDSVLRKISDKIGTAIETIPGGTTAATAGNDALALTQVAQEYLTELHTPAARPIAGSGSAR